MLFVSKIGHVFQFPQNPGSGGSEGGFEWENRLVDQRAGEFLEV